MTQPLCLVSDLDATGAKEIIFNDADGARVSVFVVRYNGKIRAFVNSCPHARLPLNFRDDQFFDVTGQYILCANHAAYFDVYTGQCVRGPCKGKSLQEFTVKVMDGAVLKG
ncbi:MAG: Rieske (2Fe-2S) protein [Rhodospirillaceae bacterium]|nr:Rieske (2Fe-2S) protein [Rhodospirillaceae bacterium]